MPLNWYVGTMNSRAEVQGLVFISLRGSPGMYRRWRPDLVFNSLNLSASEATIEVYLVRWNNDFPRGHPGLVSISLTQSKLRRSMSFTWYMVTMTSRQEVPAWSLSVINYRDVCRSPCTWVRWLPEKDVPAWSLSASDSWLLRLRLLTGPPQAPTPPESGEEAELLFLLELLKTQIGILYIQSICMLPIIAKKITCV